MLAVVSPAAYWCAVAIAALLVIAAIGVSRRDRRAGTRIASLLGLVLLGDFGAYLAGTVGASSFSPETSLPLPLCDAMVLVAAVACLSRLAFLCELTWFLGLAGTLQGVVTPDLSSPFPRLVFFEYVVGHLGVAAAALVLVLGLGITPRARSVGRCLFAAACYTAVVGVVDWSSGANYMFLRRPPGEWTLLRLLGPWPYYLASATGVAFGLFLLLDLPFARRRVRRDKVAGPLYAPLCWVMVVLVGIVVYPVMFLIRSPKRRWRLLVTTCNAICSAAGVPVEVRGGLPDIGRPVVVCANHTSFLDGLVVVLALAPVGPVTFLVSPAVGRQFVAGRFLRRIGARIVGEGAGSPRARLAELGDDLASARLVAIFPEGSVGTGPLRRFHTGAFLLAGETGSPVLPLGITGTSDVLPPGSKRPRPGAITVTPGELVNPTGSGFPAARELSARVRAAISALLDVADRPIAGAHSPGDASPAGVSSPGSPSSC